MPVYEYRCDKCYHEFEALQRITADPLIFCPQCGCDSIGRLISATSFRLMGGGWFDSSDERSDNGGAK